MPTQNREARKQYKNESGRGESTKAAYLLKGEKSNGSKRI